ncbi:lipoyl(octanoyl) transferase LipB [Demequina oxidasica]|uniref:lipoyl(octanoyl) transferase LipB n=1 Tax=Demequina oxidasica TaxID=676199 RepID=UPI000A00BD25|nr:lipoyl(octanoyl) transferase LipB [Demequina oxidasica]
MEILELGLGERLVEYHEAWDLQREIHAEVVAGTRPDTLILVEHQSVYTAGRRTASWDRPTDDIPVVDVDRGGKITWHGPGQLVGYPIIKLSEPVDVVKYVRALEQATIDLCSSYGLETLRVEDRSGVWLPATDAERERKVCAIGVRVAKGVTMHGFALNCNPDLGEFGSIVPCGIGDAGVTSLSAELGRNVSIGEITGAATRCLETALADVRLTTSVSNQAHTGAAANATPTKETV